jgi:tRNA nucleotidyltransferase (CCA-adding enzyme)
MLSDEKVRKMCDRTEKNRKNLEKATRLLSERIKKLVERMVEEAQRIDNGSSERQERWSG